MSAERWRELGLQLRVDSLRASAAAGSGHPTYSMSAADVSAAPRGSSTTPWSRRPPHLTVAGDAQH